MYFYRDALNVGRSPTFLGKNVAKTGEDHKGSVFWKEDAATKDFYYWQTWVKTQVVVW